MLNAENCLRLSVLPPTAFAWLCKKFGELTCDIQRIAGRLTFVGLLRGFAEGAEARPHQDMTDWDLPEYEEAHSLLTQLSCLVYLACAERGGEVELWDRQFDDRKAYEAALSADDYGLKRSVIGDPAVTLRPTPGELIMFNAHRVHAVRR